MTVNFLARKAAGVALARIVCEVSLGTLVVDGERKANKFSFATGLLAEPALWNQKESRMNGRSREAHNINSRLLEIRTALEVLEEKAPTKESLQQGINEYLELRKDNPFTALDELLDSIELEQPAEKATRFTLTVTAERVFEDMKASRIRKKNRQLFSPRTLEVYENFLKNIQSYVKECGEDLDLSEHTLDQCFGPQARKQVLKTHIDYFTGYYNYMEEGGYLQNTIRVRVRNYKFIYSYLIEQHMLGLEGIARHFYASSDDFEPVVIPIDLFSSLFLNERKNRQQLNEEENKFYDYILIAGVTGLRRSDMFSRERTKLVENGGKYYITSTSAKTETPTLLQISERLAEICLQNQEQYGYILPNTGCQPLVGNMLNYYIRKVLEKIEGFDTPYTSYRIIRGQRQAYKTAPFYEHVTSHVLRKTAATNMALVGIPVHFIKKFCGWAPGSDVLERRYRGQMDDYVNASMIENLYARIDNYGMKIA